MYGIALYLTLCDGCYAVNEIQTLDCRADNGSFLLSFRENVTTPIFWNATLPEFERHLEQLFT